ncbi:UNVERIFIED_CONTAM: hypothetical protein RF648_20220 [Kocuria sp. CPCC 205274]
MPDLRDLICTAERLEANGLTRRAAAAWRRVATHPAAPDALRDKIWRCAGCEAPPTVINHGVNNGERGRPHKGVTDQMRQIAALFAQGVSRLELAEMFSVSPATITRATKAVNQENQRRSLTH